MTKLPSSTFSDIHGFQEFLFLLPSQITISFVLIKLKKIERMSLTHKEHKTDLLEKLKIDCSVQNRDFSVFKLFVKCKLIADGQSIYLDLRNSRHVLLQLIVSVKPFQVVGSYCIRWRHVFNFLKVQFGKWSVDLNLSINKTKQNPNS